MSYEVTLRQVASRTLAAAQAQVKPQTLVPAIRPLFDEVYKYLNEAGVQKRCTGTGTTILNSCAPRCSISCRIRE